MSRKHRRTLRAIFAEPVRANVNRTDIEAMLVASGAELSEGAGSRVRIALNTGEATLTTRLHRGRQHIARQLVTETTAAG